MAGAGLRIGKLKIDWRTAPEVAWRSLAFIAAGFIVLMVVRRWNTWQGAAGWKTTDDAYFQADLTPVAAEVAAYIRAEPVQDYDRVRAGQLVAEIVDDDYRAAVAQAQANAAAAQAQEQT